MENSVEEKTEVEERDSTVESTISPRKKRKEKKANETRNLKGCLAGSVS